MKKLTLLYLIIGLMATSAIAQQTPLYSLYLMNDFAINPAVAGTEDYYKAQLNNRYQFVGIENAPVTASLSLFGKLPNLSMGWGAMVINDSQGAFSKFGAYGAYSYIIPLDARTDLSMGLNIGLVEYKLDFTKIIFLQEETGLILSDNVYVNNYIRPDATFGCYIKSRDYFAGLSIDQLFNNKIEVINDTAIDNSAINRIKSHATAVAGYRYKLSYGFDFTPTAVIRKTGAAPLQFEISGKLSYEKTAWAGVSVRSGDAVALLLGYNYQKLLMFAYAYDITYSRLRKDSAGSHEIMLAVRFNEK